MKVCELRLNNEILIVIKYKYLKIDIKDKQIYLCFYSVENYDSLIMVTHKEIKYYDRNCNYFQFILKNAVVTIEK